MAKCKKCGNETTYDGTLCICCTYQVCNPRKTPKCNFKGCKNCGNKNEEDPVEEKIECLITISGSKDEFLLTLKTEQGHRFYFTSKEGGMLLSRDNDFLTNGEVTLTLRK